jgi:DNA-binding response OmpR family regulator
MMRANTATQDLPIIFVTAYESLDIEERRAEAGANKVINKPINMDVLIKAIDEVLKNPVPLAEKPPAASDGKSTKTQEAATVKPDANAKQDSQPKKDTRKGKDKK